jgi:hypothetical protein
MKNLFYAIVFAFLTLNIQAQLKIGNNPTTINAGSVLEVESTNKGILYPRVSLTATTTWGLAGIAAAGMSVYNTNATLTGTATYPTTGAGTYYYDGTGWVSNNAKAVAIGTEPWYNVATSTGATTNTQNIYQMGNVGVGISTPAARLHVAAAAINNSIPALGTTGNASILLTNFDAGYGLLAGSLSNGNSYMQSQRVDGTATGYNLFLQPNAGNVGIGTANSTPGAKLEVNGYIRATYSAGAYMDFNHSSAGADLKIRRIASLNGDMIFDKTNDAYTIGTEHMRITSAGNVGIGTPTPANKLEITHGTTGNSGLRLTNLPSVPVLGTNASGDVVASTLGAVSPIVFATSAVDQVIPISVWTKLTGITTLNIDNTSAMAADKFNPKVAGYYNVHATAYAPYVTAGGAAYISIYKNGSAAIHALNFGSVSGSYMDLLQITGIIYMNGTTDFLELYGYNGGTAPVTYYAGWSGITANLIK